MYYRKKSFLYIHAIYIYLSIYAGVPGAAVRGGPEVLGPHHCPAQEALQGSRVYPLHRQVEITNYRSSSDLKCWPTKYTQAVTPSSGALQYHVYRQEKKSRTLLVKYSVTAPSIPRRSPVLTGKTVPALVNCLGS